MEKALLDCAHIPDDVAKHSSPRNQVDPDGMPRHLLRVTEASLQYQSGQARGRAEKLRRPARSEVEGKIARVIPATARHPDRDLRASRAIWLALS